jgi:hypothetical protein
MIAQRIRPGEGRVVDRRDDLASVMQLVGAYLKVDAVRTRLWVVVLEVIAHDAPVLSRGALEIARWGRLFPVDRRGTSVHVEDRFTN